MADEGREKARIDALLRAEDRALAQAMGGARTRTRRQVARVARETRAHGGGARLKAAWVKPPPVHVVRAVGRVIGGGIGQAIRRGARMAARAAGGARPVGNRGGVSFHFEMSRTGSVGAAVAHQSYIERDGACVASFGNTHHSYEERCRLWRALGERTVQRRRCIRFTADANGELKMLVQENALRRAEEGRIPVRVKHQIARLGPLYWKQVDGKGEPKIVKVWTHDADDHDRFMAVLRGVPAWRPAEPDDPDEDDRKRTHGASPLPVGVRVFRPRQTILQRRIVVALAQELPLDAQERALRAWCERTFGDTGCTWHAAIHQPEGSNDPRNWHAHIVYTTCAIGREVNADRRETGRFDFEAGSTMPKMVDMGIVLDGNGPKKQRGMRDLVRKWRADMAEEQNAELERAGVEKCYDPRSYRAQGIDLETTTHHGANRSALEASGRGALHWSAEASREWDRITQGVESYLEAEQVGPVDAERVREVLEELRLEAGLTVSDASPDGMRVAQMLRSALMPVGEEEADRHPAAKLLIDAIEDARREVRAGVRQPAWMIAWQGVQRTEPDPIRLGATADVLARGYPGDVEALVADLRPNARSVAAAARRFREMRAQWVERVREARNMDTLEGRTAAGKIIEGMRQEGISPGLVLTPAEVEWVAHAGREGAEAARLRTERRALEERLARSADPDDAGRALAQFLRTHSDVMERDEGRAATQRRRRQLARQVQAIAIRWSWEQACERGEAGIRNFLIGEGRHRLWPTTAREEAEVFKLLSEEQRLAMREAVRALEATLVFQGQVRTDRVWIDHQLRGRDGQPPSIDRIDAIAAAKPRLERLKAHAPAQWRRATQAVEALDRRREALISALSKARLDPNTDHTVRTRTLSVLTPRAGMELLRLDPELLAHQEPEMVRDRIAPIANAWCAQQLRSARATPEGQARDQILCAAVGKSQLEAFAAMARLNAMNDAAMLYRLAAESWTRIRRRRVEQRETMRDALRRLARSKTEQARRVAQGEIARLLGTLCMRVAIGEEAAQRIERRTGIAGADSGAWAGTRTARQVG